MSLSAYNLPFFGTQPEKLAPIHPGFNNMMCEPSTTDATDDSDWSSQASDWSHSPHHGTSSTVSVMPAAPVPSLQLQPLLPGASFTSMDLQQWEAILQHFRMAFELDQHLRRCQLEMLYSAFFVRGSSRKQYARNLNIALHTYEQRWISISSTSHVHAVSDSSRHQFARVQQVTLDQFQQDWKSQVAFQGMLYLRGDDKVSHYESFMRTMDAEFVQQRVKLLEHSQRTGAIPSCASSAHVDDSSIEFHTEHVSSQDFIQPVHHVSTGHADVDQAMPSFMSSDELDDIAQNFFM